MLSFLFDLPGARQYNKQSSRRSSFSRGTWRKAAENSGEQWFEKKPSTFVVAVKFCIWSFNKQILNELNISFLLHFPSLSNIIKTNN